MVLCFMYNDCDILKKQGNFREWENWRNGNYLCSSKLENPKIKGNFPDWENWRNGN